VQLFRFKLACGPDGSLHEHHAQISGQPAGSLDHTPLDWANMPNPFRQYEGVSVVAPKTFQPLVRLNRNNNNGEGEPLMRGGLISFNAN
jgi:hypothetical protein